jgi:hypothetical protein
MGLFSFGTKIQRIRLDDYTARRLRLSRGLSPGVNEVLYKIVAHNLCCLIQEQEELGIVPVFWSDAVEKAPQPASM